MRVTSFLLADAAQESNGKLYILGGGWNIITAPAGSPLPIRLRQITLVAVLSIAWIEANEAIEFEFGLVDEDGQPKIAEPPRGQLTIGRPPQVPKGIDQVVPLVVNFNDLDFDRLGTYAFTFRVHDMELARAPFHIISG